MPPKKAAAKKPKLFPSAVYVRIRPETHEGGHSMEGAAVAKQIHGWDDTTITIGWAGASNTEEGHYVADGHKYDFPKRIIRPEATQQEMYDTILPPLLDKLLGANGEDPINVLLFAYGQTGTGKTHTMLGPDESLVPPSSPTMSVDPSWGCFPRLCYDVFARLSASGNPFLLSVTAAEFYLLMGNDLLNDHMPITVGQDHSVLGLRHIILRHPHDIFSILYQVRRKRHTRSTRMNVASASDTGHLGSSRSHAALILNVLQLNKESGMLLETTFNLVDLAGAERPDKTGASRMSTYDACVEVSQKKNPSLGAQAQFINYELTCLADEIATTTEAHKQGKEFKPKTMLSTDAMKYLGACMDGTAALSMIVCLSQAPQCGWETWFSCQFGTSLSKLRAPNYPVKPVKPDAAIASAKKKIKETEEQMKKSSGQKDNKYKYQRQALVLNEKTRLCRIQELLMSCGEGFAGAVDSLGIPKPVTTGFTFAKSMFKYPLEGKWDLHALAEYKELEASTNPDFLEEWEKMSMKEQRAIMDSMTGVLMETHLNEQYKKQLESRAIEIDTEPYVKPFGNPKLKVFVRAPPPSSPEPRPAVIHCHGGGGIYMNAEQYASHCARYSLENNVTTFNLEYRLAPENKAPRGIMDAVGLVCHLQENADSLGIDKSRIAIIGDSGGAWIAAGAAMELARRGMTDSVKLVVLMFPQVSDLFCRPKMEFGGVEADNAPQYKNMIKHLKPTEKGFDQSYLYPVLMPDSVASSYPKTAIITAEFDFLRRHAEEFAELLHRSDRLVEYVCHPGLTHCWHMNMHHPKSEYFWGDVKKIFSTFLL